MIICSACGRGIPSGIRSQCLCRRDDLDAEDLLEVFGVSDTSTSAFSSPNPKGVKIEAFSHSSLRALVKLAGSKALQKLKLGRIHVVRLFLF